MLAKIRRWFITPPVYSFYALLTVPLNQGRDWHHLHYDNIPRNGVTFNTEGLTVRVRSSASPLVHLFGKNLRIRSLHAELNVSGFPQLPPNRTEGGLGFDDFAVRIGLAREGTSRLSWLDRLLMPKWMHALTDLDPERALARVDFFELAQRLPVGYRRTHPKNQLAEEEVVAQAKGPGHYTIDHTFKKPEAAFGIWLQSDGDDTLSNYEVSYTALNLETIEK